jgi:hypothetical protein
MSHAELVDFETRCEEDREFSRKLRLRKSFPSLFNAKGEDMIETRIHEPVEEPLPQTRIKEEKSKIGVWPFVLVFIGLFLAAGIYWLLFLRPGVPSKPAPEEKNKVTAVSRPAKQLIKPKPVQASPPAVKTEPSVPAASTEAPKKETRPPVSRVIELELPADQSTVSRNSEILFRWKMQTDSFTNFYLIYESNQKLAWWRGIKPGVRELKVPAMNFKPGKYYWYIGRREYSSSLQIAP